MSDRITQQYSEAEVIAWAAGYLAGYERGEADGYLRYDAKMAANLAGMLAGDYSVTDYRDAVQRHERMMAAGRARQEADAR